MGSFLTNLQVHLPGEDRAAARTRVVQALLTVLAEEGYTQCVGTDESNREVVVLADDESPWLAVYDQAAEDQSGKHVDLSRTLSRALSARVIHVHNAGGRGTGVEVTVSGAVLQERLVEIERVELFTHLAGVEQAVMTRTGRRGSELQASFPSVLVHAGPQDPLAVYRGATSIQQVVDRHKHVVTVRVHCRATGQLTGPQPPEVMVLPMGGGGSGCIQRVLVGEKSV